MIFGLLEQMKVDETWNVTFGDSDWELGNSVLQTIKGEYVAVGYIAEYGEGENENALIVKISTDIKKHTDKKEGFKGATGFEILIIFFAIAIVLLKRKKQYKNHRVTLEINTYTLSNIQRLKLVLGR